MGNPGFKALKVRCAMLPGFRFLRWQGRGQRLHGHWQLMPVPAYMRVPTAAVCALTSSAWARPRSATKARPSSDSSTLLQADGSTGRQARSGWAVRSSNRGLPPLPQSRVCRQAKHAQDTGGQESSGSRWWAAEAQALAAAQVAGGRHTVGQCPTHLLLRSLCMTLSSVCR